MKLLDYIEKLPIGGVVMNKKFLAVLKRKGLIFDYHFSAYLEPCHLYYNQQCGNKTERLFMMLHLFTKGNAPRTYKKYIDGTVALDRDIQLNCNSDELYEVYGHNGVIEYKGYYFTMHYFDGCFSPYLVKCDKKGHCLQNTLYGGAIS